MKLVRLINAQDESYQLQGTRNVQGLGIGIENRKGSIRSGIDRDGHEWSVVMKYDYGFIKGTKGTDKEHLDVYIGDNPESNKVFVVHQNDPTTGNYDEDKVMLGFSNRAQAKRAYLDQYDRPGFFGDIDEMDIDDFKRKIFDRDNRGQKIGNSIRIYRAPS